MLNCAHCETPLPLDANGKLHPRRLYCGARCAKRAEKKRWARRAGGRESGRKAGGRKTEAARARRRDAEPDGCRHCGADLNSRVEGRGRQRVFCNATCKDANRKATITPERREQRRVKSAERYWNKVRVEEGRDYRLKEPVVETTCGKCRKSFTHQACRARTFCSVKCQRATQRAPIRKCEQCRKIYKRQRTLPNQRYCSNSCAQTARQATRTIRAAIIKPKRPTVVLVPKACAHCPATFTPEKNNNQTVCETCRRNARNEGNRKKRAEGFGVDYYPVYKMAVFMRDNWECQICGRKTPQRLTGTTNSRAPELDHRKPLAIGGDHDPENLQTACRRCNMRKGGRREVGQLPLFLGLTKQ